METVEVKTEYKPDIGPTEVAFEIIDIPEPPKKISWSNPETKQLIDLYKSLIYEVGPQKKFMRKKDMWKEISIQFPNKTAKQCEERFKTVLRRKKKGLVSMLETKRNNLDSGHTEDICDRVNDIINIKHVHVWSNNETRQLMDLYKRLINEVGPQKRFVHKKDMWSEISSCFANKDPKQCEQRYNTVLKRKKKITTLRTRRKTMNFKGRVSHDTKIKINRIPIKDDDIISYNMKLQDLASQTQEVTPRSQNNNLVALINEEHSSADTKNVSTETNMEFNLKESGDFNIRKTLLEIATKKEAAKERRHRERMEAFNKMHNILEQILVNKNNP